MDAFSLRLATGAAAILSAAVAASEPAAPRAAPARPPSAVGTPPAPAPSAAAPPAASGTAPPAASAAAPAPPAAPPAASAPPATAATAPAPAPPAATAPPPPAPASPAPRAPAPAPRAPAPALPRTDPANATVHVFVDYPGGWLELRDYVDEGDWKRTCAAPCDRPLRVEGMEARVSAPGMTTSNVFRIGPGRGTARLRVSGGSAKARQVGMIGVIAGIPVTLVGMGLYGFGRFDDRPGVQTAGAVTLAVGAVTVLASLPFLAAGGTTVRDARGHTVARRRNLPLF